MTTSNIERFNEIVGLVFASLYQSFPVQVHLHADQIIGKHRVKKPDGQLTKEALFCMACMSWLVDAGYISAAEISDSTMKWAVLTAKGLEALKAMPDGLKVPLGERIVEAVKSGGRTSLHTLINQVTAIGTQWIFK